MSKPHCIVRAGILSICGLLSLSILGGCVVLAAGPTGSSPVPAAKGEAIPSSFSLLPRSFQPQPLLDMTIFTELTAAGRKLGTPTNQTPMYYVAVPDGFHQGGHLVANEKPPTPLAMDYFVRRALASAGYLSPPSSEVRPSLLIVYRWGSHNAASADFTSEMPEFANAEVLERARLVGGRSLVKEMAETMEHGEIFQHQDDKKDYLKSQAFSSCYFVVLFAYDYEASLEGERRLCWRTNMTVSSSGVSMKETIGPLIASAVPFLGREMAEPAITSRLLRSRASVEIGEAQVVEYEVPSQSKPGPTKKR